MTLWATVSNDTPKAFVCRADNKEVFLEDFFAHIAREAQRRRYREERELPEYVDLGGEA